MAFAIAYQTVCELAVWHHHWLDSGAQVFTLPPNPAMDAAVQQRLLDYDVRRLLRISPTAECEQLLKQKGLRFKTTAQGCFLAAKDSYAETQDDFRLTLEIRLLDPRLLTYTDLGVNTIQRRLFHLTNVGLAPVPRLLLTSGGNNSVNAAHYQERSGRIVRIPKTNGALAAQVQVFDTLSTLPGPVLEFNFPANAEVPECELDCRSLLSGRYRFQGTNIATVTYYVGLEDSPGLLGVVDLVVKNWEGSFYDVRLARTP